MTESVRALLNSRDVKKAEKHHLQNPLLLHKCANWLLSNRKQDTAQGPHVLKTEPHLPKSTAGT